MLNFKAISADEAHEYVDDIAALRISVFRDWPYLYDGDMAYEKSYLENYLAAQSLFFVVAFDGGEVVGASTAMALADADNAFSQPLVDAGYDIGDVFYFAESVLLSKYRGQGAGHRFFDMRESEAARQGFRYCTFCAVERDKAHPLADNNHKPLDEFWRGRGFEKLPDVKTAFAWKDIGSEKETEKPMQFWLKTLS